MKMMTWIIDGATIDIEKGKTGYFATGPGPIFRGLCMANTLDDLYKNIKDGIELIRQYNDQKGE